MNLMQLRKTISLDDYASFAHLTRAVQELRAEAKMLVPRLKGRRVLMVNSTAQGGGVAEMIPMQILLLRELGLNANWAVIGSDKPEFFKLTKRLHNLIHGEGDPHLSAADKALYDEVSRQNADQLRPHLKPEDVLITHDPQPLGAGALLRKEIKLRAVWRCHIGLDEHPAATRAAWMFLKPYAEPFDHAVFSAPEYIPDFLAGRATLIHPAIDPLSHKNRELHPHKLAGILSNSGMTESDAPVLTSPFPAKVQRLQPDGSFGPANQPDEIGLLYRPVITQVSRWDRLKGFRPLMDGFARFKGCPSGSPNHARHNRRREIVRLVLAGPDPQSIKDDPEGREVLEELRQYYLTLPAACQRDIVLLTLPMESRKHNALMVNALQRCSVVVAQNSLREGFGLTATEAMWKAVPVLGTSACGLRQQIRDGVDGRLVNDPNNPDEIASVLDEMLQRPQELERCGRNAQLRVHSEFLIFTQLSRWLRLLAKVVSC
ncbi:MAG: glycosyltransferase [Verrucomicrobia bacterium]|jgi:trehalose synthase|nr:glycosyltransferase [Verrucomicrobiota bacterium]